MFVDTKSKDLPPYHLFRNIIIIWRVGDSYMLSQFCKRNAREPFSVVGTYQYQYCVEREIAKTNWSKSHRQVHLPAWRVQQSTLRLLLGNAPLSTSYFNFTIVAVHHHSVYCSPPCRSVLGDVIAFIVLSERESMPAWVRERACAT